MFPSIDRLLSALLSRVLVSTLCYPSFSLSLPLLLVLPGNVLLTSPPFLCPKLIPSLDPFACPLSTSSSPKVLNR